MSRRFAATVLPVWAVAVALAVVLALVPPPVDAWTGVTLGAAGCIVLALVLQVLARRPDGFVGRAAASAAGVVAVFAIAALVLWLGGRVG